MDLGNMMTASGIRVTLMKERGLVSHCGLNTERKYKFKSPIKKKSEHQKTFFKKEGRGRIVWIIVSLLHMYKPSKM